jgi:serine/threonine protein kinase/Flp pilus assembly protein TadD
MNEETLFYLVLSRPAGERTAVLEQACAGDEALRRRVEVLLRAHENPGGFLGEPAANLGAVASTVHGRPPDAGTEGWPGAGPPGQRPPLEGPGTVLGPYTLRQQIGEGGMGDVFLAEQAHPVQRTVALKILKAGMDSRQVIARFQAERQALALMDHPHIARVFDAGATASGRPFFVMELVSGVPITGFCDEHRLPVRRRLELLVRVCHAVQHAHQKGVIHRDLKPSNVLVTLYDGQPVPKVIDFGVAKATGPKLTELTLQTEFGTVIGTPEYMSPEQAELNPLDVDTRSDVYALGVLLYELLTATTPLEHGRLKQASLLEALRIIREEEPARPSARLSTAADLASIAANRGTELAKLRGLVRGELDWIAMKCLEKDRNHRYETANALALDLERYLRDEAVRACPPSAGYRLRKLVRRNKGVVAVAAVVAAALLVIVGTVAGSLGWVLAERDSQRQRAGGAVQEALRGVVALRDQGRWREALASVQRVEELLTPIEGSSELQQSVREHRRDLEMVLRIEEIRGRQGEVKQGATTFARTDAEFGLAFRDYGIDVEALGAEEAGGRLRARAVAVELAVALDEWAAVQKALKKNGGAAWKHLVAVARVADPDPWRVRLREARASQDRQALIALAESADVKAMPARTLHRLGKDLEALGEWDRAANLLLPTQRQYPNDFWINAELAYALDQVKPPRSIAAARYASIAAALRSDNEVLHYNLGWYLSRIKQYDDAIVAYRRAAELYPGYSEAYRNLSQVLAAKGDLEQAVAVFRDEAARKPKIADVHFYLGAFLKDKAERLLKQGKTAEAEGLCQEAVAAWQRAARLHPSARGSINLAWIFTTCSLPKLRDPVRALEAAHKAVDLAPQSELAWQVLGWAEYRSGNWQASVAALEKSMALQTDPKGGDPWQWFWLAMAHARLGHPEEARKCYRKAVAWVDRQDPRAATTEEVRRFQAEAAALLEVGDTSKSTVQPK